MTKPQSAEEDELDELRRRLCQRRQDELLPQRFHAWEGYTIAFNGDKGQLERSMVRPSTSVK